MEPLSLIANRLLISVGNNSIVCLDGRMKDGNSRTSAIADPGGGKGDSSGSIFDPKLWDIISPSKKKRKVLTLIFIVPRIFFKKTSAKHTVDLPACAPSTVSVCHEASKRHEVVIKK